jgi:hypothetical protein
MRCNYGNQFYPSAGYLRLSQHADGSTRCFGERIVGVLPRKLSCGNRVTACP